MKLSKRFKLYALVSLGVAVLSVLCFAALYFYYPVGVFNWAGFYGALVIMLVITIALIIALAAAVQAVLKRDKTIKHPWAISVTALFAISFLAGIYEPIIYYFGYAFDISGFKAMLIIWPIVLGVFFIAYAATLLLTDKIYEKLKIKFRYKVLLSIGLIMFAFGLNVLFGFISLYFERLEAMERLGAMLLLSS